MKLIVECTSKTQTLGQATNVVFSVGGTVVAKIDVKPNDDTFAVGQKYEIEIFKQPE